MISSVVPLRMIAFQCLFLLVAIAIEGYILQRRLQIVPRTSIEFAASVNLLSVLVGWLVFFGVEPVLPPPIQLQLISFILFGQWAPGMANWIVPAGFVTFFISFFIKLQGLSQLRLLLYGPKDPPAVSEGVGRFRTARDQIGGGQPVLSGEAATVLLANSLSHSAISLILLIRFFANVFIR
jgi:hypothetical protein